MKSFNRIIDSDDLRTFKRQKIALDHHSMTNACYFDAIKILKYLIDNNVKKLDDLTHLNPEVKEIILTY